MQFSQRQQQHLKDGLNIVGFVAAVFIGAWLINLIFFRSFSVIGPSMEPTMYTNDRLIINRLPVTVAALQGRDYLPLRGHVVVFKNPHYTPGGSDEYVVKRVIAFAGERVVVNNGNVTVYNTDAPGGFDPYVGTSVRHTLVSGNVDETVPVGEIFVIGDNRSADYSLDSRNGLGTIPLLDIIGPVAMRIYPITEISSDF